MEIKKLMTKNVEEEVTNVILEQVRKNGMTISNLRRVTAKAIGYLESNATLEVEGKKVAEPEDQVPEQPIEEIIMESNIKTPFRKLKAYDPK